MKQDGRHSVVKFSDQFVCLCRNDCARGNHVAAIAPGIPDTRERERHFVIHLKIEGPLLSPGTFPFKKAVCRNQASTQSKRLAEAWFFFERFRPSVDKALAVAAP